MSPGFDSHCTDEIKDVDLWNQVSLGVVPKVAGAVQGVPGGGAQRGSAPHWPLHPGGLFRQTQADEPAH